MPEKMTPSAMQDIVDMVALVTVYLPDAQQDRLIVHMVTEYMETLQEHAPSVTREELAWNGQNYAAAIRDRIASLRLSGALTGTVQ